MKLIKLSDTHYIVISDEKINQKDAYYDEEEKCINYSFDLTPYRTLYHHKVIATTIRRDNIPYISLDEVKELLGKVDTEKLGNIACKNYELNQVGFLNGFEKGYQQALADNKEKQYTKEDIEKSFQAGAIYGCNPDAFFSDAVEFNNFIDSLFKTEWNVEFIDGKLKLV